MFSPSVWHKGLLAATLNMPDTEENVRQSNLQLAMFRY